MRHDFDFVTMADYRADMKESAANAVRVITVMKERAEHAEKLLSRVLLAAGKVSISDHDLHDERPIEMITWRNEADRSFVFEAKRC